MKLNIQVLVATMYQKDFSLLQRMNIQSPVIVINQCNKNATHRFSHNDFPVIWIDTDERGVGRSRNRAIMAAEADILLFADDDVVYDMDAISKVVDYFSSRHETDMAVFALESLNPARPESTICIERRLHFWNCLKYGAFQFAIRRESLLHTSVFFSLEFGGGAKYQAGEDNLFITKMIFAGLTCNAVPIRLGTVAQENSTWFKGYNEKYYCDRGALFAALYGKFAKLMILLFEIRHFDKSFLQRVRYEFRGIDLYER